MTSALAGRTVLVTRERPGELGRLLAERGAIVRHVPLIAVVDPDDGGAELRAHLERLHEFDWLVVTSAAGAERVAPAAGAHPTLRLAAVGTATARALEDGCGRRVDVVPPRQIADALAAALLAAAEPRSSILVAQADRSAGVVVDELTRAGHRVTAVVAYRTVDLRPGPAAAADADAVVFASGSAVESWVGAFGATTPPVAVAIGPSTAATARRLGLKLTSVATDHSLDGLVTALERDLAHRQPPGDPHGPATTMAADLPE